VERRRLGRLVVEGPRLLAEALDASLPVHEVFVERAEDWPGATVVRAGTLDRLGDAVTSQGVLAVVGAPAHGLWGGPGGPAGLARRWRDAAAPVVLVLVDVADPGNAGTILRSAEASGVSGVIFAGRCVDPLSPKVVRSAAGALFRIPWAVHDDVEDVLRWLAEVRLETWATVVSGGQDLYGCELRAPAAVLLGSEAHGLATAVVARCDHRLTIPMAGAVESLNVAMAATVIGFETWRRRRLAVR